MQGRLENDIKVSSYTQKLLKEMPDYANKWYIKLRASDKQARTCDTYITTLKRYLGSINANIKEIKLDELTSLSVDNYLISTRTREDEDGLIVYTSASYQKTIWSALNSFFGYLEKEKIIPYNFMKDIDRTRESDDERLSENRILLTKDDFNSIIECVQEGVGSKKARTYQAKYRNRDMAIFLLFMTTGMRREEMREINVSDIDMIDRKIVIITKRKHRRSLAIEPNAFSYICAWLEDRKEIVKDNKEDALFVGRDGKRMTGQSYYKLVDKYCTEALGYHISPHKLRSGFCSILLNEWGDVHAVMKAVGHRRVETTLRYAVTRNNEQTEGANLIGSFLNV